MLIISRLSQLRGYTAQWMSCMFHFLPSQSALFDKLTHRILRATEAGDIHSYIICPSAIHGLGTGPVERSRVSSFAKLVVSGFRSLGRAIYVGEGTNEFGLVSTRSPDIPGF